MLKRRLNGFALLLILTSALAAAQDKPSPKGYRTPDEVASSLRSFVAKHPQAAKLVSVGKSTSGRDISVLRLALPGKSNLDPDARPAVFVAANLEGVHLPGTEAALALADALLAKSASDKKIQTLLETRTVYIAPLLNPDGAGLYFAPLRCERWTNARPADDDADGVPDEDGPDDLNKDGLITQMRVKDPEGKYIADPKEPRLMRPADPKKRRERDLCPLCGRPGQRRGRRI